MNAAGAALRMESEDQLRETLLALLQDPERLRIQQEQGEVFAARKVAVIDRVMSALTPLLMRAGLKP